jgi:hypothetical protein
MPARSGKTLYAARRRTQSVGRKYTRIRLSKDARAAVTGRQREAARRYKKDLDTAWAQIDDATQNIATTHNKSVRHVQGQFHMGRILSHGKHSKISPWNAFMWKKGKDRQADESKYIFSTTTGVD